MESRFKGCLLGLACGDAVGTTLEFKPRGGFEPVTDRVRGGLFRLRAGEWTDDTSMALCLAVSFHADSDARRGFEQVETGGLSSTLSEEVLVTRFNDVDRLRDHCRRHGDELACFITEPFIGTGGFIPALPEYLETAWELTRQYGALLIFDEVINGFRFRAGDTGRLYGIQPDLAALGKAMGGGMPVSAVTGRADVMSLVGREKNPQVLPPTGASHQAVFVTRHLQHLPTGGILQR